MLTAAGPGLASLQDYTQRADPANNPQIQQQQGDTLDTYKFIISDNTNSATIAAEDDCIVLDETDINGWPSLNLLQNPSFEGTYVSGIAPNWLVNQTGAGVTYASSATAKYGSASQSVSIANCASNLNAGVIQHVALPFDENGNTIRKLPYYLSVWVNVTTAFTGIGGSVLKLDWYNGVPGSGGTFLTNSFIVIDTLLRATTGGWVRIVLQTTPPANANYANVVIQATTNSATNSGTMLLDGAQMEYGTFYNDAAWPAYYPVQNPNMQGTLNASYVNNWIADGNVAGVSYGVVASPSLYGTAQSISVNNPAASSNNRGIQQLWLNLDTSGTQTYTLTAQVQVTQALTNGAVLRLGVNIYNVNYQFLSNFQSVAMPQQNNQWVALTLTFGAGTANPIQAGSVWLKIYMGIETPNANATGAVVIGQISCTRATLAAGPSGIYPTPYMDNTQPGCYTDTGRSGLYYRHLRLFGGFVKTRDNDYTSSVERSVQVSCVDYGTLLAEAPFTGLFQAMQDTAAIAQAVTYAQQQGYLVGLDASTFVQAIGTIDSQAFTMNTMRDVMNYISNQTVASYWVDPYIRLHYVQALAVNAPFALSDQPDMVNSFPYTDAVFSSDSSNSATEPVIEGGSQVSAPQTYSGTGTNATLSAGLTSGTNYSALPVNALTVAVPGGTKITINVGGGTTQVVTTSQGVQVGATSIPVTSFTANSNYASSTPVAVGALFTVYGGNNIHFVDSVTANSISLVVGLSSNDQLGAGSPVITAVFAPNGGVVQLLTAIGASQSISVVFRFDAPVLVRVRAPGAESGQGTIRRKIFVHTKLGNIKSKASAIDRANADNAQNAKAKPVVTLSVWTPPTPTGTVLRPGMAIQLSHRIEGYSAVLMQIQQVTTLNVGNGIIVRQLQLGFYRPDAIILLAQVARDSMTTDSNLSTDSVLQDVLSSSDGWAMTDSAPHGTIQNIGKWGGTTSSTWGGTYVWG